MPPKQSAAGARASTTGRASAGSAARGRGRPKAAPRAKSPPSQENEVEVEIAGEAEELESQQKTIPSELLTRLLHEFFDSDGTRITKDANGAAAKYMDIFVREAIARAAAERDGGFLEVEDLEKVAPQLLLDL